MTEDKKKTDPFQLITLIIIVGSIFLGLYYTNVSIGARFDSIDTAISGNGATLETIINRLDAKVEKIGQAAAASSAAEPAAEPADGEEGAAAAGEGEEAKAAAGEEGAPKEGADKPKAAPKDEEDEE